MSTLMVIMKPADLSMFFCIVIERKVSRLNNRQSDSSTTRQWTETCFFGSLRWFWCKKSKLHFGSAWRSVVSWPWLSEKPTHSGNLQQAWDLHLLLLLLLSLFLPKTRNLDPFSHPQIATKKHIFADVILFARICSAGFGNLLKV